MSHTKKKSVGSFFHNCANPWNVCCPNTSKHDTCVTITICSTGYQTTECFRHVRKDMHLDMLTESILNMAEGSTCIVFSTLFLLHCWRLSQSQYFTVEQWIINKYVEHISNPFSGTLNCDPSLRKHFNKVFIISSWYVAIWATRHLSCHPFVRKLTSAAYYELHL
jgi:hypothetical protein